MPAPHRTARRQSTKKVKQQNEPENEMILTYDLQRHRGCPTEVQHLDTGAECVAAGEFPKSLIHPDKYRFRQYLVDAPDPELRRILHHTRLQDHPLRNREFMNEKPTVFYLNRKGWMAQVIHDDLRATLCDGAIASRNGFQNCSTVVSDVNDVST
jgi:hypothetical protein